MLAVALVSRHLQQHMPFYLIVYCSIFSYTRTNNSNCTPHCPQFFIFYRRNNRKFKITDNYEYEKWMEVQTEGMYPPYTDKQHNSYINDVSSDVYTNDGSSWFSLIYHRIKIHRNFRIVATWFWYCLISLWQWLPLYLLQHLVLLSLLMVM